ncbi:hypothetical protein SAMN05660461_4322 [Chitinophaga ginsengisegetis]|uniref:Immunity protein Imm33 domain-containing protein n=1 Tax=Chitinophaga ginsengisegetis TaxID=393003 RepID=A0A1T5P6U8_9BACT|nr:DUF2185 domain-containing protein [Chitinophaga ginsengisegetis]SKD08435.1 hypothetical protein SAMN05660461_4322 [Chitinophaga ginsengisegetis]
MEKKFKLLAEELVELIPPMGGAIATDRIVVDGMDIGYMYREDPINEMDSGWRFFEGSETSDYLANSGNSGVYHVNTIANYDPTIIPYLDMPEGTKLERIPGTNRFREVYD